jgi:superfamily II DNA or RNA helicase/intein/homing endonuclease
LLDSVLRITIPKKKFNCVIRGYSIPHQILRQELSFEIQGSEYSEARKNGYWDGMEYLYDYNPAIRNEGNFPFGLLPKVLNILNSEGCSYEITDERNVSEKSVLTELNVKLREYQEEAVRIAIQRKYGILNIATGGGKCIKEDTLIPTSEGLLPISYFKNLDRNVQLKSKSEYVYTDEIYDGGVKNTIKIKTQNGYSIEGTYNHPILVLNEDFQMIFKPLERLTVNDVIVLQYNTQLFGFKHINEFIPHIKMTNELNKDFALFLSYYLEHGEINEDSIVFNNNPAFLKDLLYKLFINEDIKECDNKIFIKDNVLLQLLLNKTSSGIPSFVLQLEKAFLFEFISYYINHFNKINIISDIQVILLNFGVISKYENEKLTIINNHHFYNSKNNKLNSKDAYLYSKDSYAEKTIKTMFQQFENAIHNFNYKYNGDLNYSHLNDILKQNPDYDHYSIYKKIESISKDFYFFDSIQNIDYSCSQVYDFVVPQNHSFVANGFVNHNTKTSTGIIHRLGRKTVFYVHTIDLLDQAKEEFEKTLNVPIGQVGGGIVDIQDITVATIQTVVLAFDKEYINTDSEIDKSLLNEDQTDITNYKEAIRSMVEDAEVIFFDECQHLGAESFYEIAKRSYNATFRYGLSATPWRDDGKELYIEAGLGEIIYSITASWLIDNGHLIRPTIKFYDGQQVRRSGGYDKRPYQTIYKEDIVENEKRNRMIVDQSVVIAKRGKTNLIIIQQKKHGEIIQKLFKEIYDMDVPFVHGGVAKKKRRNELAKFKRFYEPQLVELKDGTMEHEKLSPILIASTIADEGLDIPHLASVTLAGGGKSTTRILQRVGRAIRLYNNESLGIEKNAAFIMDFIDNSKYLFDHSMIRRSTMQKEKAFIFK